MLYLTPPPSPSCYKTGFPLTQKILNFLAEINVLIDISYLATFQWQICKVSFYFFEFWTYLRSPWAAIEAQNYVRKWWLPIGPGTGWHHFYWSAGSIREDSPNNGASLSFNGSVDTQGIHVCCKHTMECFHLVILLNFHYFLLSLMKACANIYSVSRKHYI